MPRPQLTKDTPLAPCRNRKPDGTVCGTGENPEQPTMGLYATGVVTTVTIRGKRRRVAHFACGGCGQESRRRTPRALFLSKTKDEEREQAIF